ncbi:MAG TPA: GAF domain-containing SpoIIE family protein phosphatase [Acidimicrobiales bacterium]|jgi:serine phosphatase RsbU (regulator of sigma subunit)
MTRPARAERPQVVARRLGFLLAASQSVAARLDEDDALAALARIAVTAMADLCIIDLREPDGRLRRAAVAHADRDIEAQVREALYRWPPDAAGEHPAAEALRTGETQQAADLAAGLPDAIATDPDAAGLLRRLGLCSSLAVPLTTRGRTLGTVLLLSTATGLGFGPDDVDVAEDLARLAALAVDNARLVAAERAARETAEAARARVALLAEATSLLTETLQPITALERLAALMVPGLADWCRVDLLDETVGVRRAAMAHVDPAAEAAVLAVEEGVPVDPSSDAPMAQVLRTGSPLLLDEATDDVLVASARTLDQLAVYRSLGLRSLLVVPLQARGEVLGTLTLGSAGSERHFDEDDLALARDLGRRAGLAVDNARLYQREHRTAAVLQQALLPKQLAAVPGLALAARYLPATTGAEVGGDWYDVLPLADGRVGLVIGDVVGHDIEAASVMGTLRHVLRAYAWPGGGPASVIRRVDELARGPESDALATLVYALYDPARHQLAWSSAGHPPPLLVRPDGRAEYLLGANSTLVGVGPDVDRTERTATLDVGTTLVLYTDGLVETRVDSLTNGLDRLAALAQRQASASPDDLVDLLLTDVEAAEQRKDDIAILVARVVG